MTQCHVCGSKIAENTRLLRLSGHALLSLRFVGNLFDLAEPERQLLRIITDAIDEYEAYRKSAAVQSPETPQEPNQGAQGGQNNA